MLKITFSQLWSAIIYTYPAAKYSSWEVLTKRFDWSFVGHTGDMNKATESVANKIILNIFGVRMLENFIAPNKIFLRDFKKESEVYLEKFSVV